MTKYTNSPLVSHTRISPTTYGRRTLPITNIVPHHTAGVIGIENLGGWFAKRTTRASSNYGIGSDGRIGMYCEEKNMACTTSSYWADARAVTIEVSNSATGGQWPISNLALEATIKLITDICARNGIYPCTYTGDLRGTLWRHDWFANKVCPGPYFGSKFLYIAQEVTKRLDILRSGGKTKPIQTSPTYYNYPPGSYEILRTIYTYDKPSGKVKGKIVKGTKVRAIKEVRSGVPGVWSQLDNNLYIQAQEWRTVNVKKIAAAKPTPAKKSIDAMAKEVIDGKHGTGAARREKLESLGYNYQTVQNRVNEILLGTTTAKSPPKTEKTFGTWRFNTAIRVRSQANTNSKTVAVYQAGQTVNLDGTLVNAGYVWGTYIGGSGIRRYVALRPVGGAAYGTWV